MHNKFTFCYTLNLGFLLVTRCVSPKLGRDGALMAPSAPSGGAPSGGISGRGAKLLELATQATAQELEGPPAGKRTRGAQERANPALQLFKPKAAICGSSTATVQQDINRATAKPARTGAPFPCPMCYLHDV